MYVYGHTCKHLSNAAASLQTTPPEVLSDICEHVDDVLHPASLLAFSQANRACRRAAQIVHYRCIKVLVDDQVFASDLDACWRMVVLPDSLQHVRHLIIEFPRRFPWREAALPCRRIALHCDHGQDDKHDVRCRALQNYTAAANSMLAKHSHRVRRGSCLSN